MKWSNVPVDVGPPVVRHRIRGTRLADVPIGAIELLMHRHIRLKEWKMRTAADAYWRLYWPTSGGAEVVFEGRKQILEPGCLYLITPHTAFDSDCARPFTKWYIHFTVGGLDDYCRPAMVSLRPTARMRTLLARTCPGTKHGRRSEAQTVTPLETIELIVLGLQLAFAGRHLSSGADSRLARCIAFLRERMPEKIALRELAQFAGVSVRTLSQMFVSESGFPPMRYLLELRLNHTMKLLRHTNQSIEQIAEECGFGNRYYFTRMFSKYRQTSPAAFRAQAKRP